MESRYRGYQLHPVATHRGWGVVLEDPAGHVADLCLHRQLGHGGWQRLEDAEQAAKRLGRAGPRAPLSMAWEALGQIEDEPLLFLAAKSPEGWLRDMVIRYMAQAPGVRPLLTGDDLLKMGVLPSRKLGQILETVYMAQLDGRVKERDEALKMARTLTAG